MKDFYPNKFPEWRIKLQTNGINSQADTEYLRYAYVYCNCNTKGKEKVAAIAACSKFQLRYMDS